MDIIYRDMEDFARGISSVVDEGNACGGYTTCMWHNLITSKIVYDRSGKLRQLQETYRVSYPVQLKKNIIENNLREKD